jgi:general secretion pathway protein I
MSARIIKSRGARGFTLLEVMVAMAILALALVALSEIDAGAINMHSYAKRLNVAAMLARQKMLDIETDLDEKGLPAEGDNIDPSDGDFDDQGFPQYKWKVEVVAPKADNLDPQKIISMVLGGGSADGSDSDSSAGSAPGGMPDPGKAGGDLSSLLGSLTGLGASGSKPDDSSGAPAPTAGGMSGLGGMAASALAGPAQMMITQITQMVREVRLTVTWMDGSVPEEFTVVEQIVSMGPSAPVAGAGSNTKVDTNPANQIPGGVP